MVTLNKRHIRPVDKIIAHILQYFCILCATIEQITCKDIIIVLDIGVLLKIFTQWRIASLDITNVVNMLILTQINRLLI